MTFYPIGHTNWQIIMVGKAAHSSLRPIFFSLYNQPKALSDHGWLEEELARQPKLCDRQESKAPDEEWFRLYQSPSQALRESPLHAGLFVMMKDGICLHTERDETFEDARYEFTPKE